MRARPVSSRSGTSRAARRCLASVPLPKELDKYGLSLMPVTAFFDVDEASKYIDQWVRADGYTDGRTDGYTDGRADGITQGITQGLAKALLSGLMVRGLDIPRNTRERISSCTDHDTLQRWFTLALTETNIDEFVKGMG